MPNKNIITSYEPAAKTTVDLLEYSKTPEETGISVESLTALYSMYETGARFRRMRLDGEYEAGRLYRRRLKK
jgi:hypothetical protein